MNNDFTEVTELSKSIVRDVRDAQEGLAALLTDRDCDSIYTDLGLLIKTLNRLEDTASMLGTIAKDMKET